MLLAGAPDIPENNPDGIDVNPVQPLNVLLKRGFCPPTVANTLPKSPDMVVILALFVDALNDIADDDPYAVERPDIVTVRLPVDEYVCEYVALVVLVLFIVWIADPSPQLIV